MKGGMFFSRYILVGHTGNVVM